jgi:hypothetical protein
MTPTVEQLLFTQRDGSSADFYEVLDDGLDGGYAQRFPDLIILMRTGTPYHRFLAGVMLTAWGQPAGLQALIAWAQTPAQAPWAAAPVTFNRLTGADSAFAELADALRTSLLLDPAPALQHWQHAALEALLAIYHQYFFSEMLAVALRRDQAILQACKPTLQARAAALFGTFGARSASTF